MSRAHKNIPVFIPHLGCPHACVFCDQRTISGCTRFDPEAVIPTIEEALTTLPTGTAAEIAYFGGSFTAIDPMLMRQLLDIAIGYVVRGQVSGIRFSTRPDAVGEELLDVLSAYPISAIELGLQSMDDRVLALCRRGHDAATARDACRRIVARGIPLVGQMMIGLPGASEESELQTAQTICDLGACAARVYPTVVFAHTALHRMMECGEYIPLTDETAAARCAPILELFEERDVNLLRVGLCAGEGLSGDHVVAGASHPALGELAYSALFVRRMSRLLSEDPQGWQGKNVTFLVPSGKTSQALGQHRSVARALCENYGLIRVRVHECGDLQGTQVRLCKEQLPL